MLLRTDAMIANVLLLLRAGPSVAFRRRDAETLHAAKQGGLMDAHSRAAASRLPSARSSAARMVWPSSMSRAARMPPSPLARPRATSSSGRCSIPMKPSGQRMKARSITFSNWRTLPGQSWAMSRESASAPIPWTARRCNRLKRAINCSASSGMSSLRRRNGGSSTRTTLMR